MSLGDDEIERLQSIVDERTEEYGPGEQAYKWGEEFYGNFVWRENSYEIEIEYDGVSDPISVSKSNSFQFFQTLWIMARNGESLYSARRKAYDWETISRSDAKANELEEFTDRNGFLEEERRDEIMDMLDSEEVIRKYCP